MDSGENFDARSRQLVGSARFVFNYATASRLHGQPHYLDWANWGLKHLKLGAQTPEGGAQTAQRSLCMVTGK
ncbi:MAG: AGE family epimerase/isomerase [Granulosicoccus sp.]